MVSCKMFGLLKTPCIPLPPNPSRPPTLGGLQALACAKSCGAVILKSCHEGVSTFLPRGGSLQQEIPYSKKRLQALAQHMGRAAGLS